MELGSFAVYHVAYWVAGSIQRVTSGAAQCSGLKAWPAGALLSAAAATADAQQRVEQELQPATLLHAEKGCHNSY
jgi:hypothetical protein